MMNKLIKQIKKARFIWICGNGGSASTAEHLTADLVKKGYPAICLNSNVSVMTMIANDYGYEEIFSRQLLAYATNRDLLITISCSGTSPNIREAQRIVSLIEVPIYEFKKFNINRNYGLLEDKHLKFAHEVVKQL